MKFCVPHSGLTGKEPCSGEGPQSARWAPAALGRYPAAALPVSQNAQLLTPHPRPEKKQPGMLQTRQAGLVLTSLIECCRRMISPTNRCFLSHTDGSRILLSALLQRCPDVLIDITSLQHPPPVVKTYLRSSKIKRLWSSLSEHATGLLSDHGPS